MSSERLERIREQFTRQGEAYIAQPDVADQRSLEGLAGLAGASEGDRALDVACGPGFLTRILARRCRHVHGVDATPAFLEFARREASGQSLSNVEFDEGDAEKLPYSNDSFELITCRSAFHHFPNPGRVLDEMRRVLVPEGRICIADMLGAEDLETSRQHDAVERLCDPTHASALALSRFETIFRDAKLGIERQHLGELDHSLAEWIEHGGPATEAEAEIRARMRAWLEHDAADLGVHLEGDEIHFRHRVGVFLVNAR